MLSSTVISPISAAELETDLYALPCENEETAGKLSKINPDLSGSVLVGNFDYSASSEITCASSGAYNPSDGHIYWVSWPSIPGYLIKTNPITGESSVMGEFNYATDSSIVGDWAYAIAIDSRGNAYVVIETQGIFSVNLSNAAISPIVDFDELEPYAFAFDPSTDKFIFSSVGREVIYEFDDVAKTMNLITTGHYRTLFDALDASAYSLTFDDAGNLYSLHGDLHIVDADSYEKTTISEQTVNLNGAAEYGESIIAIHSLTSAVTVNNKRFYGVNKINSVPKAAINRFVGIMQVMKATCTARKERDAALDFKSDKKQALKIAKAACAVVRENHPDAEIKTVAWITAEKPTNLVKVRLAHN
jgi:hypothetical protein